MKFSVSKDKLLEGLSTVQNVVSTRTTLPILSNVLLQASDGEIRLTTTDLDVGIRGSVEAQVERTGATTLPARRLLSIVRELPSSEIYFDVEPRILPRSGAAPVISRFWDCQKKSFLLWPVLKRRKFSRSLKKL